MKKVIVCLAFLLFSQILFAQISGSTKPGRLIPKKEEPKEEIIQPPADKIDTGPQITIINPALPPSNIIQHKESIITVRGKAFDAAGIKFITVNGNDAVLLQDNLFFANVQLKSGTNTLVVKATNLKDVSSEIQFNVITDLDETGPQITIIEPQVQRGIKVVRKTELTNIRGIATDPAGVLEVYVNNQKAKLLANNEFNVSLFLHVGDNPVIIKAVDNKFNSTIDTFYITRKLEDVISVGRYIALVIGINSYGGYWRPLNNALNDAEGVARILRSDYHFDEVISLLDEEATRRNIIQKFEWLAENVT